MRLLAAMVPGVCLLLADGAAAGKGKPRAAPRAAEAEAAGPAVSPFAKQTARAAFLNAERLFREQRFAEAEVEYKAAYSVWPLDGFFFNIAQCERNQDHTAEAIDYFERYQKSARAEPHRAEVEALLEELRQKLLADAPKDSAFAPPPRRAAPLAASAPRPDGGAGR